MKHSGKARSYWPTSIAIHLLLLGLIFFIPAKQYFQDSGERRKPEAPPEIKRRGEELEKVMEQVRDIAAERIAGKVALLDAGAQRMMTNFDTLNKYHQPTEDRRRETAVERMQVFAERVLSDMSTLQAKLETAKQAEQSKAKLEALEEAQPLGSRVLVAQEEVRRGLMFIAAENEALLDVQAEAEEAQISAVEFIGWGSSGLSKFISTRDNLEELRSEQASLRKALKAAQTHSEELAARVEELRIQLKDVKDERKRRFKELSEEARAEFDKSIEELDAEENELAVVARGARTDLNRARRDLKRMDDRLERVQETFNEQDEERSWQGHLRVALNVQTRAFYAQRTVINALLEQARKAPIFTDE